MDAWHDLENVGTLTKVGICHSMHGHMQGTGSSLSQLVSSHHLENVHVYTSKVLFVIYLRFWLFHRQYFNMVAAVG